MTHNRCAYAPCAATLRPDGPSPWFCDETCQRGWMEAQNRTTEPAPAQHARERLPIVPITVDPDTLTLAEEAAQYTWPSHPAARDVEEPVDELRYAVRLSEPAAWPVLAVTPTPELSRPGWLARAFDRIRSTR